jgi:hypothetical protein
VLPDVTPLSSVAITRGGSDRPHVVTGGTLEERAGRRSTRLDPPEPKVVGSSPIGRTKPVNHFQP